MNHHWCIACDQGWVLPVLVEAIGARIWCCDECEAVWFDDKDVGLHEGDDTLGHYLSSQGLSYMDAELIPLGEPNSPPSTDD